METDCKQVEVTGSIGTPEYVLSQMLKEFSRCLQSASARFHIPMYNRTVFVAHMGTT